MSLLMYLIFCICILMDITQSACKNNGAACNGDADCCKPMSCNGNKKCECPSFDCDEDFIEYGQCKSATCKDCTHVCNVIPGILKDNLKLANADTCSRDNIHCGGVCHNARDLCSKCKAPEQCDDPGFHSACTKDDNCKKDCKRCESKYKPNEIGKQPGLSCGHSAVAFLCGKTGFECVGLYAWATLDKNADPKLEKGKVLRECIKCVAEDCPTTYVKCPAVTEKNKNNCLKCDTCESEHPIIPGANWDIYCQWDACTGKCVTEVTVTQNNQITKRYIECIMKPKFPPPDPLPSTSSMLASSSTEPPDDPCEPTRKYYYVSDGKGRTYDEAQAYCQTHYNSDLATINTLEQLQCALSTVGEGESPFIGLYSVTVNRKNDKPHYFINVDGTKCPRETWTCVEPTFWYNEEPLPCYIGTKCVRLLPNEGRIYNDMPCDKPIITAVLCNNNDVAADSAGLMNILFQDHVNGIGNAYKPNSLLFALIIIFILSINALICLWCHRCSEKQNEQKFSAEKSISNT